MKNCLLILFLFPIFTFCSSLAKEECETCENIIKIRQEVLQKVKRTPEQKQKIVMKSVAVLEKSVKNLNKKNKETTILEMVKLLGAVSSLDNYHINAETILPAYNKHQSLFKKEIMNLPKTQQSSVVESLKIVSREMKEGNG